MNLQKPSWLLFVLGIAVVSFLVVFQPIRRAPASTAETQLVTELRYTFARSVATTDEERGKVIAEIAEALEEKEVGLDARNKVEIVGERQVKVSIVPLSAREESEWEGTIREVLSKYGEPVPVVEQEEKGEAKYVARLGPLAVYKPQPMIRLGLDLVGGSQLLLRCLPQATFYFKNPEPFYPDTESRDQLRDTMRSLLQEQGYDGVEVLFPEDDQLTITVRVESQADVEEAQKRIRSLLRQRYPGLDDAGNPDSLLLDANTLTLVETIIENRVNALGVAEATVQRQGGDKVLVQLPGVQDPTRAINLIGRLAKLEFRHIPPKRFKVVPNAEEPGGVGFEDVRSGDMVLWKDVYEKSKLILTGRDLKPNSTVVNDQNTNQPTVVTFEFRPSAADIFRRFTRAHIGEYLAIVLDGQLKSCPVIQSVIPGEGIITGQRSTQEASDLMKVLNAGALPVPIEIAQTSVVSATLGRDSVTRSLRAGLWGALAIFAFMAAIYGACGLLADVALLVYSGIVLGLFVMFGATLTLPGIAGFILSMGMAVDANVLIFERLKEELRTDKTVRAAVEAGFARAWTAILDSNVTTILAAIVLFGLGTGGVRGFALTLTIGVLCSMFTAITVTRVFVNQIVRVRPAVRSRFFVRGLRGLFAGGGGT